MPAFGMFQSFIAPFCKAFIAFFFYKPYIRKIWTQIIYTSIGTVIIHNNRFRIQSPACFYYRMQALLQEVPDIIIYYDDG